VIKKIDHINISVTDLEKSKKFFVEIIGFKVKHEGVLQGEWIDKVVGLKNINAKYVQLSIAGAETNLELIQYFNPIGEKDEKINQANQIGFRHLAFEVKEIEKIHQNIKNFGVRISEIQVYNVTKKLCYFEGPDEIILELCEYEESSLSL
jgi:catechol 2,3-dioxygenase-like lactoylglutathione lyase family enzyme